MQEFSIISDIEDTSNSETDGTLDPDIQVCLLLIYTVDVWLL